MNKEEVEAIAKDLKVEAKDVLLMEERLSAHDTAFDTNPADDDSTVAPATYFADSRFEPSAQLEFQEAEQTNHEELISALSDLDERSRDIVTRRWLCEPKETLQQLAEKYSVSAERIRQIEKKAFDTLRGAMPGSLQLPDKLANTG